MYEKITNPTTIAPPEFLDGVASLLSQDERPRIVFSDFDLTLCDMYDRDGTSNNHVPVLRPEVVVAAQGVHLVVATGRRANHPHLSLLWESGLLPEDVPVIAENGGTLVTHADHEVRFVDLLEDEEVVLLKKQARIALKSLPELPTGQKIVIKEGRTCMIARLEDDQGIVDDQHQSWLEGQLMGGPQNTNLQIVNARTSIVLQHARVDKNSAFRAYMAMQGLERDEHCIVGMGDAKNDAAIFAGSDVRIGFSGMVKSLVDIVAPDGVPNAAPILELVARPTRTVL